MVRFCPGFCSKHLHCFLSMSERPQMWRAACHRSAALLCTRGNLSTPGFLYSQVVLGNSLSFGVIKIYMIFYCMGVGAPCGLGVNGIRPRRGLWVDTLRVHAVSLSLLVALAGGHCYYSRLRRAEVNPFARVLPLAVRVRIWTPKDAAFSFVGISF